MQKYSGQYGGHRPVSAEADWRCAGCGCVNNGGARCWRCGWQQAECTGNTAAAARQENRCACDDCPSEAPQRSICHCEDNTTLRAEETDCTRCGQTRESACTQKNQTCEAACACTSQADVASGCTCRQRREADCDCAERQAKTCTGCDNSDPTRGSSCADRTADGCACSHSCQTHDRRMNRYTGIVWAARQEMEDVYDAESALRTGTLFPCLHKPLNGYCPRDWNCADCAQQTAFAAWDLRLYLNTHPTDEKALCLFRRLAEEAGDASYATAFLPDCRGPWRWTDDPWPWECRFGSV